MAQHGLDGPEVGAAAKQGRGKAVAQRVGRDGLLDAGLLGLPLYHDENHRAGEVGAAAVEKHVVFLTGFNLELAPVVEPELELMDGIVADGNESFLPALALHADELLLEEEIGELEVDQFADAQSAGEEYLNDGLVALALRVGEVDGTLQLVHLLGREHLGQMFAEMRPLQEFGGVVVDVSFHAHVLEERPYAAQDAALRRGADAILMQAGGKVLEVFQFHLLGLFAVLVHIAPQPVEVVYVGVDGVGGIVAVQLEIALVR